MSPSTIIEEKHDHCKGFVFVKHHMLFNRSNRCGMLMSTYSKSLITVLTVVVKCKCVLIGKDRRKYSSTISALRQCLVLKGFRSLRHWMTLARGGVTANPNIDGKRLVLNYLTHIRYTAF